MLIDSQSGRDHEEYRVEKGILFGVNYRTDNQTLLYFFLDNLDFRLKVFTPKRTFFQQYQIRNKAA